MLNQSNLKMFASFRHNIFIPLIGDNKEPVKVYGLLKDKGARISLGHVKSLIDGKERVFNDFEILDIKDARTLKVPEDVDQPKPPPARPTPVAAKKGSQVSGQLSGAPAVARGRGREYSPEGIIKPLKRGTTYAQMMEMLMKGATMKELLDSTDNVTQGGVNDVLSWQVKQRGYGLRFEKETGKYFIVLPKGHTALTYQH